MSAMLTRIKRAKAIERVREAGVEAPDRDIFCWINSVGPDAILRSTLQEIREVAGAF